ncbi:hypothetical protein Bca4012_058893 [Brassica carinata]
MCAEQIVGLCVRQPIDDVEKVLACVACTASNELVVESRLSKPEDRMVATASRFKTSVIDPETACGEGDNGKLVPATASLSEETRPCRHLVCLETRLQLGKEPILSISRACLVKKQELYAMKFASLVEFGDDGISLYFSSSHHFLRDCTKSWTEKGALDRHLTKKWT